MKKRIKVAIDLDNTITEYPKFFSIITRALVPSIEVVILTNRENSVESKEKIKKILADLDIFYSKIVITAKKTEYVIKNDVNIFIDDTDEYFLNLPKSVCVLKIREPGNFDFDIKKWYYDDNTGENIL